MAAAAGIGAAGDIVGGTMSMIGAGKQADATKKAATLQAQSADNSLNFNKQVYNTTLGNEKPYLNVGVQAANQLGAGLSDGSLTAAYPGGPFSFTGVNLQNDPAFNFDLQQGQQSIQRSAAAQGGLVSGGALKDLNDYSQGYASNQFQQSYNNALGQYQQAYNQFENQQANNFNRLSSIAGLGQNAATMTATSGNSAASTGAAISQTGAAAQGNYLTQGAVASSAGLVGMGNALGNAGNGIANWLSARNPSASSYGPAGPPPAGTNGQY